MPVAFPHFLVASSRSGSTLLNCLNDEIVALGKENFFHADYEATLLDTYGADYEETLIVEGGQVKETTPAAAPILEKNGYKLEVTEFADYVQPNLVVESESFFRRIPRLSRLYPT